ncbi:MAG: threonine--tRNA ligase [Gemmatimonadetes bacterium]|nr:MAG: threonine--tRNA ligase [Gemmatimonadota bacterium]
MNKWINITLPDGSVREFEAGVTGMDIAKRISKKLKKAAIAAKVNGVVVDLSRPIEQDATVEILTFDDPEGREVYRHSSTHIMAQAVTELFPEAKPTLGPPLDDMFYYDFDVPKPFTPEDLAAIEKRANHIIKQNLEFKRFELSREEALKFYHERVPNHYKCEIIEDYPEEETWSFYQQGDGENGWVDMCRGPHVPSTGRIKQFKILKASGAYWRGNENNKMLQRIYGTAYESKEQLEAHLHRLEEAEKRDHRRLGRELDLFSFHSEDAGAGFAYWHHKGALIRELVENFLKEEQRKRGYIFVVSPHVVSAELYKTSGHYEFFRDNMYPVEIEGEEYFIKPMNCPCHVKIFDTKLHSYRDLPVRMAEFGTVYRYEKSGVLHGLLRVRGFTQDDAHIFCTEDQLDSEIRGVMDLMEFIMQKFGFHEYKVELSVADPNDWSHYAGEPAEWERAEHSLVQALRAKNWEYTRHEGEAAFYGPKIDLKVVDALGRPWQCSTVQFDFNLPRRFGLKYIGSDGEAHMPYMVHRAIYGSVERFIGVLIEQYGGAFPTWLAPTQVVVATITDAVNDYAQSVVQQLHDAGFRVHLDDRNEKIGYKIREHTTQKVPYILVVGHKEAEAGQVAVRKYGAGDQGVIAFTEFLAALNAEVETV